jgi:hypothetical protein
MRDEFFGFEEGRRDAERIDRVRSSMTDAADEAALNCFIWTGTKRAQADATGSSAE